ncbi:JAB domain-containing protein [Sphingobacterium mizutaii]
MTNCSVYFGMVIDIEVYDHLIVGVESYYSLKDRT